LAQPGLTLTEAPIKATTINAAVRKRSLRAVSHENRLAWSHARMPVAPAAAVAAPITH
jgi:hypothetical protein